MTQQSFSSLEQAHKKKRTKREIFLGEMEAAVPWARLEALIAPHYTKQRLGRPQMPLAVMLRIYFLQQWYYLSDPGAEEALYDMHSMREFAGLDLAHDAVPDETTILNFRHLLERHNLTEVLFEAVSSYLQEQSLLMRGGTIMDATLIAASPSTKNKTNKRDPDMSQTKKGNQWYFGMKAHIGVDAKSGLVHTIKTTTAKVHDARMTDDLIRTDDAVVFGDKGLCQRQTQARLAGRWRSLGGERQAQTWAGLVGLTKETEPKTWLGAGQGRAYLPRHQMPVWLSQGALSGLGQKRGPNVQPDGAGQPLPRAAMSEGGICLKTGKTR